MYKIIVRRAVRNLERHFVRDLVDVHSLLPQTGSYESLSVVS